MLNGLSVHRFGCTCMWCFVSLFLVVSTSAIDCLERLVSEMTNYVLSGTLNPTHSFTVYEQFLQVKQIGFVTLGPLRLPRVILL